MIDGYRLTFAVGYVLVMSILGTVLMGASGWVEGLVGVAAGEQGG